jgi:signal transduction histidine kinase
MARIRLKTKLVLAISAMVFALVLALSFIYMSQLLRQRINESYENADFISHQIYQAAKQALEIDLSNTRLDMDDPQRVHDAIADVLQSDAPVNTLLQSVVGYDPEVYDVSVIDLKGNALLHTDAAALDKPVPNRPSLDQLKSGGFVEQIKSVYGEPAVYDIRLPIQREGTPFGEIRVGISTLFLKNEMRTQLDRALLSSAILVFFSFVLAAALSNLALRPLEAIGRRLDVMTAEVPSDEPALTEQNFDEYGLVNTKIDRLGRQIRDVKEVFSALKENLDQIMGTLQDGLMLFTNQGKVVLVSASVERFIGRPRGEILGCNVEQIFDDTTRLGQIVLDAFALHQGFPARTLELDQNRKIQISIDFISESGRAIGTLLTIRDAESVRRIENEIELSRRLAAIGRLTSGVAHEVKNPINAIVIHLEILRERMLQMDPETKRHMDIISSEFQRLDRVVKTLVDFSRPMELRLEETDLRRITDDVVAVLGPEAQQHGVTMLNERSPKPLPARVDEDLVKQALLNVVLNGVQAMQNGGTLTVRSFTQGENGTIEVIDQGTGIPPDVRDKIFNLYFTTKTTGSGIGLAMTYRVLQLHNGALEFESEVGKGTTFRLVLPLMESSGRESQTAAQVRGAE